MRERAADAAGCQSALDSVEPRFAGYRRTQAALVGYFELARRDNGEQLPAHWRNELDAIAICRGYVEAQQEYALQQRALHDVNQYAQRIISTPEKQDGLAWQKPDGSWGGPVGQNIARAIAEGYTAGEPYHGYSSKS